MSTHQNWWCFSEDEGGTTIIESRTYTDDDGNVDENEIRLSEMSGPDCDGTTSECHYVFMATADESKGGSTERTGGYKVDDAIWWVYVAAGEDPEWPLRNARDAEVQDRIGWLLSYRPLVSQHIDQS